MFCWSPGYPTKKYSLERLNCGCVKGSFNAAGSHCCPWLLCWAVQGMGCGMPWPPWYGCWRMMFWFCVCPPLRPGLPVGGQSRFFPNQCWQEYLPLEVTVLKELLLSWAQEEQRITSISQSIVEENIPQKNRRNYLSRFAATTWTFKLPDRNGCTLQNLQVMYRNKKNLSLLWKLLLRKQPCLKLYKTLNG